MMSGCDQTFNKLATGSGSLINNISVDGKIYIYYQAQPIGGGNYTIGYLSVDGNVFIQRCLNLANF